jgi:hypothetical protein
MMSEMDNILDRLIPKSLDDIIRANKHLAELRLADEREISAITGEIWADKTKDEISNFRLVSIIFKNPVTVSVHLLGTCSARHAWYTSQVMVLDLQRGYAQTRSGSLYKLIGPLAVDEPGTDDLICLCAALNTWGVGQYLGVPAFFY